MKILVTGGAGFIGSNLVDELARLHHEVVVYDNLSTGSQTNLLHLGDKVKLVKGDILDFSKLKIALKDCDGVVHLAALRSVAQSVDEPIETNEVNVKGTLNVLQAATYHKVKRFVYASSSSIYGNSNVTSNSEIQAPKPISPYGVSKLAGEYYVRAYREVFNLSTVSLRFFNVFGPRQNPESKYSAVIPSFISKVIAGKPPIIEGSGKQSRDFTYVGNVVSGIVLALTSTNPNIGGEYLNLSTGGSVSLLEILSQICSTTGISAKPKHISPRVGDIFCSQGDITKAKKLLGYKPKISFEQGLKLTVDWFVNSKK